MELESLAVRLRSFREAKGLTKYRLAKLCGISETYLYRLELGQIKNPRRDTLQTLARGLNITLAELVGETAPIDTWKLVEQSLKAYIPVYAGLYEVGMVPIDYAVCTRAQMPSETVCGYRIDGLSFEPEIRDGDTLIVDSGLKPELGDLVLATKNGQVMVGCYGESGDAKWLEDSHGRYQLEDVLVHGVITQYVRKLRQN